MSENIFDPKKEANTNLPAGRYYMEIVGTKLTTSSKKGTPGIQFKFKVLKGKHENKVHVDHYWLSKNARGMFGQFCLQCGVTEPFDLDDNESIWKAFRGKRIGMVLKTEEYKGVERTKIDTVKKLSKKVMAELDTIEIKAPVEIEFEDENEEEPMTGAPSGDSEIDDDDIPF